MAPYHRNSPSAASAREPVSASSGGLDLQYALLSDPGRQRGHNEDYLGYSAPETIDETRQRGWLFALADGVGGQDLGEVASRTAVEAVIAGFGVATLGEAHAGLLSRLVQAANIKV
jgi:serine/threonine protein phosphatase PrpC